MLHEIKSISEDKPLVNLMVKYMAENRDRVCEVCGLKVMGHNVETIWLGYGSHDFTPIEATPEQIELADTLMSLAYKRHREELA